MATYSSSHWKWTQVVTGKASVSVLLLPLPLNLVEGTVVYAWKTRMKAWCEGWCGFNAVSGVIPWNWVWKQIKWNQEGGASKISVCGVASLLPPWAREVCFRRDSPGVIAVPPPPPPQNCLFKGQRGEYLLPGSLSSLVKSPHWTLTVHCLCCFQLCLQKPQVREGPCQQNVRCAVPVLELVWQLWLE